MANANQDIFVVLHLIFKIYALHYALEIGLRNSQATKKVAAVNSCVKSKAETYPSENDAILRSVIPKSQDEIPNSQIPFLKFPTN